MTDPDVNAKQAAALLGCPIGWIYDLRRAGELTPSLVLKSRGRHGEESFYRLSEVRRSVEARRRERRTRHAERGPSG